jgi:hypothetical protein
MYDLFTTKSLGHNDYHLYIYLWKKKYLGIQYLSLFPMFLCVDVFFFEIGLSTLIYIIFHISLEI